MEPLEQRIQKIEERNRSVENDKAWETSWARKALIVMFTYLAIAAFFHFIDIADPWVNALVPVFAFLISTFTMSLFKTVWVGRYGKK